MMEFWKRVLIDTILFIALAGLFAGTGMFYITSAWIAPLASFVLAILNVAIKPILVILSLPINILTLGLFSVVINGIMLQLTSMLVGSANFSFFVIWFCNVDCNYHGQSSCSYHKPRG